MGRRVFIGIDGGGSGSRGRLVAGDARHEAEAGPANAFTDPEGAATAIAEIVTRLRAETGLDETAPATVLAGVAGCRLPELANDLARRLPFPARILDDSATMLRGALGPRDGALAALGTGSFFARREGNTTRHAGGWGFDLGDAASGAWLGRRAVAATLALADRGETDPLAAAILADSAPHPLIRFRDRRPSDFARLAPVVLAHAATPLGRRLIADTIAALREGLVSVGHAPGAPLVVTGGFGAALRPHLPDDLAADLADPAGDALDGALALAEEEAS